MKKVYGMSMLICFTLPVLAQNQIVTSKPIEVDGFLSTTESTPSDEELEQIKAEIQRQKKETVLNKQKAKSFKELSASVEKLSETTEEYLSERKAAQEEIANYNAMVKCRQMENPGAECDKYIRRR